VQIVSYHETEDEALSVESEYIGKYGQQLVNWQNSGRGFDYKAIEQYWTAKKANEAFVAETRPLETSNPALAIERYQEAMRRMYEYESLVLERGLVADLNREMGMEEYRGDKKILNRLTLCLWRQGRYRELIDSVDEFVKLYPRLWGPMIDAIMKRKAKAESILAAAS
jgi:tetratricopeptide (TPR) repeat protein